jgi:aminopeptidase N
MGATAAAAGATGVTGSGGRGVNGGARGGVDGASPVFRTPVEIAVRTARGVSTFRVEIRRAEETFVFPLASRPAYVAFDPGNRVLKTLRHDQSRGELLQRLANDPEAPGRVAAARLLAAYPDPDVVRALGRALRSDRARAVRMGAAIALGEARSDGALAILVRALAVDDPWVRRAVVFGIGCYRDPRAQRALARVLDEDPSYLVRATALFGIVHAKHPDAFSLLEKALAVDSHTDVVRGSAFDAMAALKDPKALPVAMTWSEYGKPKGARCGAVRCLGALGKGDALAYDRLLHLLADPMHEIRNAAATALGALGEKRATGALEARLAVEPHDRVRQALRKAIAKLGGHPEN